MNHAPLVRCTDLCTYFPLRSGILKRKVGEVRAVHNVSLTIEEKEIVGIIGESGSGKTTLARTLIRLSDPTSGQIVFDNIDITKLSQEELRPLRKRFQIVFQNPSSSLNSRKTIYETLEEVVLFHQLAVDVTGFLNSMMKKVGLNGDYLGRYPHELSIGQMQRVCLARALCTSPELLVLDECVSALDISVQAQVLNLLLELHEESNVSYLFISHDIAVVQHIADRIVVMYNGEIVEQGPTEKVLEEPTHPYTKLLLSSKLALSPK